MKHSIAAAAIAGLVALGAASQAAAVTVVGAKSITITSALPDWLQVGELIATDFSAVDVALASNGATANSSSDYVGTNPGYAIDGLFPVNYPNIFHSGSNHVGEYLTVTFAAAHDLASLTIFGRNQSDFFCCRARDFYNYAIFNAAGDTITSGQLDARSSGDTSATVRFDQPTSAAPEPASWALMIMGLGGVGAVLRRRSALTAAA